MPIESFVQKTCIFALALFLSSFSVNNPVKELPKDLREQIVHVPSGLSILQEDTSKVTSFFAAKYEVSNKEYRQFLISSKDAENWEALKIDTSAWHYPEAYLEPVQKMYHQHPAYDDYPVVCISKFAAEEYCRWLENKFGNEYPNYEFSVRLPTRSEFIRMASPLHQNVSYAWGGPDVSNKKGCVLANFKPLGAEDISYDSSTGKYMVVEDARKQKRNLTLPVSSYSPGYSGQYNLNGNAAEMTLDGWVCGGSWNSTGYDIRNESAYAYEKPSPEIGFRPVFYIQRK